MKRVPDGHRNTSMPVRTFVPVALLLGLAWAPAASAVGQPSTYPGCANRSVTVAWGGTIKVDLATCHSFGLGDVSKAPAHGTATPGDTEPLDGYVYTHEGQSPAGGGSDRFVVLDDNSDLITVQVTIRAGSAAASALSVSPSTLPALHAGVAVDQALTAGGGTPPYVYRISAGALPDGVTLDPAGRLTGTPTARAPFSVSLQVQDAQAKTATASYSGKVLPAPLSLTPARATAIQGAPFSQALAGSGGVAPHTLQLEAGKLLPTGIQVSADGVVRGTTSVPPGDYPVNLRITDSSTGAGEHFELETFTLQVSAPPTVSISVSPAEVAEDGPHKLTYTVTRDTNLAAETVVTLSRTGAARFGSGPTGAPATVTIPAGATSASFVVKPTADRYPEPDEAITFTVVPGPAYRTGTPASATGTIADDDTH